MTTYCNLQSLHTVKIQVVHIQVNTIVMLQLSPSFAVIFKFFVLSHSQEVSASHESSCTFGGAYLA